MHKYNNPFFNGASFHSLLKSSLLGNPEHNPERDKVCVGYPCPKLSDMSSSPMLHSMPGAVLVEIVYDLIISSLYSFMYFKHSSLFIIIHTSAVTT